MANLRLLSARPAPAATTLQPSHGHRIGFHRTPGIAYVHVLTGEIIYMVDRQELRLWAGELVVERGTEHSWRNEGRRRSGSSSP
jgi:quercetin dioxygenase-like cupin family protein